MADGRTDPSLSPFSSTLGEMMRRGVRTIPGGAPACEAAREMTERGIGSLVVVDGDTPLGIVTKSDLVRRVLAMEGNPQMPVREVASAGLLTVEQNRPIFDGLLLMLQYNIGHVVVTDQGEMAGIVSERDWLTFQERHPAALLRHFDAADTVQELAALREKANRLVRHLFLQEGTARALTALVTEINDRVSRRVIELSLAAVEQEGRGKPPVPFAWLAMGSEGRGEQTLSTDQDNGLVFADVPEGEEDAVRDWFLHFAEKVVDGLEVCGFPRCKGNVMASNPALCHPLAQWQHKFAGYLAAADPHALLRVSMYFDFRCLYGEASLVKALWATLLERINHSRGFLRHMAGHVMVGRPPVHQLGWRLRTLLRMDHPAIDLKNQALAPLVSCMRVLALAALSSRTNTLERLTEARSAGLVDDDRGRAVGSAYEFLMLLRLRQHFRQEERGEHPHNLLVIEDLNPLRRRFLTESLETVMDLQEHVFHQYAAISYL